MEIPSKSKGEHYNLRWNSYTNNLLQVLLEHQLHENLVDVTLFCEGQFIKAHKLVLSACSEVFQDMFKIHDVRHPMILLNGIKFNHFKHILEFIYQGEVKVLDVDLEGVLALGESLQVKGLSSIKLKHKVSSEEPKVTTLKTNASLTESRPNSSPCSPALNHQTNLNPVNNGQIKRKDCSSNNRPLAKDQNSSTINRFQTNEQVHSGLKKIPVPNSNMKTDSNKNISKLESILTDQNETTKRKRFKPAEGSSPVIRNGGSNLKIKTTDSVLGMEKNSRPPNAFMIFANEWRKKLKVEHPEDNNKEISVKLGNMWKSLSNETKQSYYMAGRKMELEHKTKSSELTSKDDATKRKKMTRRKTIDSISHLVSVDLQEFDDEDDLQIIEVNEDPIEVPDPSVKRNCYTRKANTTT